MFKLRLKSSPGAQVAALNSYLQNGNNLAFGFDPDCHFSNNGNSFTMTTRPITTQTPEPASMAILGTGITGMLLRRRKRKNAAQQDP